MERAATLQTTDRQQFGCIIPHVVNHSLALLRMGKKLSETCWADLKINKLLFLHLVGLLHYLYFWRKSSSKPLHVRPFLIKNTAKNEARIFHHIPSFLSFAATPIILHITVTALSQINLLPFQDHLRLLKRITNSGKICYHTSFFPLGPALEFPKLTEHSQWNIEKPARCDVPILSFTLQNCNLLAKTLYTCSLADTPCVLPSLAQYQLIYFAERPIV